MSAPRDPKRHSTRQQDIFAAADRLAAAGSKLTLETLRRELGGGSYRDLSPALRAWRAAHGQGSPQVPQAVAGRAQSLACDLWTLAAGLAEERLQADRSAMLREQAASAAQHAETAELADRLTAELDSARADRRRLRDRAGAAVHSAAQLQGQLEELQRQAERDARALRDARQEARAARDRAAQLQGRLDALRARQG